MANEALDAAKRLRERDIPSPFAAFEAALAELEKGAAGFAFASGLAAEAAMLELLDQGAHVVASNDLYGGTWRLFHRVRQRTAGLTVTEGDVYLAGAALLGLTLWPLFSRLSRTTGLALRQRRAPLAHGLAGLLSAAAGILLAGYGGHAPVSGGDEFTLPSLLAIETAVGRRGGDPIALLLSVPMVLAADILMLGLGMKYSERVASMGVLFLLSIVIRHLAARLKSAVAAPGGLPPSDAVA
jgi:hypothetical protein